MKWHRYIIMAGMVPVFISLASCHNVAAVENEAAGLNELPVKVSAILVNTVPAKMVTMDGIIRSQGKITAARDLWIMPETGGLLLTCYARTGMYVQKGAVLARLDTIQLHHKLERLKLARFNAEKEYESQLIGYENLLKAMSADEAAAVKQKLRISTGFALAEQEIKERGYELLQSTIRAPYSGIIADMQVQQGTLLKPGQVLFRIYDPGLLEVQVRLLESDVMLLKPGLVAEVFPISNSTGRYKAAIHTINPYVDKDGMVIVSLAMERPAKRLNNEQPTLFPGMNCMAEIRTPMHTAIVIPAKAVVMRNGKAVVFTAEDGRAKWNDIVIGRENGEEIEVKSGLSKEQKVIVSNNLQLAHDAPVKEVHQDVDGK
jgi:membrane fusion protein, multidrug efflux system